MASVAKSDVARITFRAAFVGEETKLLKIERACYPLPWTRDEFQSDFCLSVCCSAFDPDHVFGYLATRRWADAVIIENIAVDPEFQRNGIGRQMLDVAAKLIPAIGPLHRRRTTRPKYLECWVWERNVGAQLFLRACGFKAGKSVPGFYLDEEVGNDAAIHFSRPIVERFEFEAFPQVRIAQ